MNIIIVLIYSVLLIYIIHYTIKFILLKEKIYNYKKNTRESFVEKKKVDMENELLTYLDSNISFYELEDKNINNHQRLDINIECKKESISEKPALDIYFENQIDNVKEIDNKEERKKKEGATKVPKIIMKNKKIENQFENGWSYENENIMNGGMINQNLSPWDSSDNYSIYDKPF